MKTSSAIGAVVGQPVETIERHRGATDVVFVTGALDHPVVAEDQGGQLATPRFGRQRGRASVIPSVTPRAGWTRVAAVGHDDGIELERIARVGEAEREAGSPGREAMTGHSPATGRRRELQARRELGRGTAEKSRPPAVEVAQRIRADADDLDRTARLGRAAVAEDRCTARRPPERGVAVDRDDGWADRQPGSELGHPQVEPGPVGRRVADALAQAGRPAHREHDRAHAQGEQGERGGWADLVRARRRRARAGSGGDRGAGGRQRAQHRREHGRNASASRNATTGGSRTTTGLATELARPAAPSDPEIASCQPSDDDRGDADGGRPEPSPPRRRRAPGNDGAGDARSGDDDDGDAAIVVGREQDAADAPRPRRSRTAPPATRRAPRRPASPTTAPVADGMGASRTQKTTRCAPRPRRGQAGRFGGDVGPGDEPQEHGEGQQDRHAKRLDQEEPATRRAPPAPARRSDVPIGLATEKA